MGKEINDNGCYLMSILFHASQKTGHNFDISEILKITKTAIHRGFLRGDCYVLNPEGIFGLAGLRCRYTDRYEGPDRRAKSNEIEILYYRWRSYGHFVAGVNGIVAYDPLGPSNIVKNGRLRSKRIFLV